MEMFICIASIFMFIFSTTTIIFCVYMIIRSVCIYRHEIKLACNTKYDGRTMWLKFWVWPLSRFEL